MTEMFLLAFAFLCGIPTGVIVGALIVLRMTAPDQTVDDIDYSGGV